MKPVAEIRELVAGLAEEARARGLDELTYHGENVSVSFKVGVLPAPPQQARELSPKEAEQEAKAKLLARKRARLRQTLGRDPTDEEIAEL